MPSFIVTVPPSCIKSKAVHRLIQQHASHISSLFSNTKKRRATSGEEEADPHPLLPPLPQILSKSGILNDASVVTPTAVVPPPSGLYLCSDPPNAKLGSGGGTIHALFQLYFYCSPPSPCCDGDADLDTNHNNNPPPNDEAIPRVRQGCDSSFSSPPPSSHAGSFASSSSWACLVSPSLSRGSSTSMTLPLSSPPLSPRDLVEPFLSWCSCLSSSSSFLFHAADGAQRREKEARKWKGETLASSCSLTMRRTPFSCAPTRRRPLEKSSVGNSPTSDSSTIVSNKSKSCQEMVPRESKKEEGKRKVPRKEAEGHGKGEGGRRWLLPAIVLHAGGRSERLPAFTACGKWKIPIKEEIISISSSSSCPVPIIFSNQYYCLRFCLWPSLPPVLQSHFAVLVSCGDTVLRLPPPSSPPPPSPLSQRINDALAEWMKGGEEEERKGSRVGVTAARNNHSTHNSNGGGNTDDGDKEDVLRQRKTQALPDVMCLGLETNWEVPETDTGYSTREKRKETAQEVEVDVGYEEERAERILFPSSPLSSPSPSPLLPSSLLLSQHGVFVLSNPVDATPADSTATTARMPFSSFSSAAAVALLQKPNKEELQRWRHACPSSFSSSPKKERHRNTFLLDVGVWLLSQRAVEALARQSIEMKTVEKEGEDKMKKDFSDKTEGNREEEKEDGGSSTVNHHHPMNNNSNHRAASTNEEVCWKFVDLFTSLFPLKKFLPHQRQPKQQQEPADPHRVLTPPCSFSELTLMVVPLPSASVFHHLGTTADAVGADERGRRRVRRRNNPNHIHMEPTNNKTPTPSTEKNNNEEEVEEKHHRCFSFSSFPSLLYSNPFLSRSSATAAPPPPSAASSYSSSSLHSSTMKWEKRKGTQEGKAKKKKCGEEEKEDTPEREVDNARIPNTAHSNANRLTKDMIQSVNHHVSPSPLVQEDVGFYRWWKDLQTCWWRRVEKGEEEKDHEKDDKHRKEERPFSLKESSPSLPSSMGRMVETTTTSSLSPQEFRTTCHGGRNGGKRKSEIGKFTSLRFGLTHHHVLDGVPPFMDVHTSTSRWCCLCDGEDNGADCSSFPLPPPPVCVLPPYTCVHVLPLTLPFSFFSSSSSLDASPSITSATTDTRKRHWNAWALSVYPFSSSSSFSACSAKEHAEEVQEMGGSEATSAPARMRGEPVRNAADTSSPSPCPPHRGGSANAPRLIMSGVSLSQWLADRRLTMDMIFPLPSPSQATVTTEATTEPKHGNGISSSSASGSEQPPSLYASVDMWKAKLFPCVGHEHFVECEKRSREGLVSTHSRFSSSFASSHPSAFHYPCANNGEDGDDHHHHADIKEKESGAFLYPKEKQYEKARGATREWERKKIKKDDEEERRRMDMAVQQLGDWLVWMTATTAHPPSPFSSSTQEKYWLKWWEATRESWIHAPRVSWSDIQQHADLDAAMHYDAEVEKRWKGEKRRGAMEGWWWWWKKEEETRRILPPPPLLLCTPSSCSSSTTTSSACHSSRPLVDIPQIIAAAVSHQLEVSSYFDFFKNYLVHCRRRIENRATTTSTSATLCSPSTFSSTCMAEHEREIIQHWVWKYFILACWCETIGEEWSRRGGKLKSSKWGRRNTENEKGEEDRPYSAWCKDFFSPGSSVQEWNKYTLDSWKTIMREIRSQEQLLVASCCSSSSSSSLLFSSIMGVNDGPLALRFFSSSSSSLSSFLERLEKDMSLLDDQEEGHVNTTTQEDTAEDGEGKRILSVRKPFCKVEELSSSWTFGVGVENNTAAATSPPPLSFRTLHEWEAYAHRMADHFHYFANHYFKKMAFDVFRNLLVIPYWINTTRREKENQQEQKKMEEKMKRGDEECWKDGSRRSQLVIQRFSSPSSPSFSLPMCRSLARRGRGVRVQSPVRIDLCGGWTDFPPYCFGKIFQEEKGRPLFVTPPPPSPSSLLQGCEPHIELGDSTRSNVSLSSLLGEFPQTVKGQKNDERKEGKEGGKGTEEWREYPSTFLQSNGGGRGEGGQGIGEEKGEEHISSSSLGEVINMSILLPTSSSSSYPIVVEVYRIISPSSSPFIRLRSWNASKVFPTTNNPLGSSPSFIVERKGAEMDEWDTHFVYTFENILEALNPSSSLSSSSSSSFSIPLLAFLLLGWGPPLLPPENSFSSCASASSSFSSPAEGGSFFTTLKELLLHYLNGDSLALDVKVELPSGSGLGTSSALAAAILYGIRTFMKNEISPFPPPPSPSPPLFLSITTTGSCGEAPGIAASQEKNQGRKKEPDNNSRGRDDEEEDEKEEKQECGRLAVLLEQLLGTGGGWQDAVGAIFPGVKLLSCYGGASSPAPYWPYYSIHIQSLQSSTEPSPPGFHYSSTVPPPPPLPLPWIFTHPDVVPLHLLYFSGFGRQGKNITTDVAVSIFLRTPSVMESLETIHYSLVGEMKAVLNLPPPSDVYLSSSSAPSSSCSKSTSAPSSILPCARLQHQDEGNEDPCPTEQESGLFSRRMREKEKDTFDSSSCGQEKEEIEELKEEVKSTKKEKKISEENNREEGKGDQKENVLENMTREKSTEKYIQEVLQRYGELIQQAQILNSKVDPARWQVKERINTLSTPLSSSCACSCSSDASSSAFLDLLLETISPFVYGAKFCGAGGGGFLYLVARSTEAVQRLKELLTPSCPPSSPLALPPRSSCLMQGKTVGRSPPASRQMEMSTTCNHTDVLASSTHIKEPIQQEVIVQEKAQRNAISSSEKILFSSGSSREDSRDGNHHRSVVTRDGVHHGGVSKHHAFSPHPNAFFLPFTINTEKGLFFEFFQ